MHRHLRFLISESFFSNKELQMTFLMHVPQKCVIVKTRSTRKKVVVHKQCLIFYKEVDKRCPRGEEGLLDGVTLQVFCPKITLKNHFSDFLSIF